MIKSLSEMIHCQSCSDCIMRQEILPRDPSKICEHSIRGICTLEEARIPHTLEEIGLIMGITRERIRQIQDKALRKLRHPKRAYKLKPFYIESLTNKREDRQPFETFGG